MGGQESKTQTTAVLSVDVNPQDQSHFFVEEITRMTLNSKRQVSYYWIDPKVYNAENQKYYNQFSQNFQIDSFTSLEGLKSQLDEIQNNSLIKVVTAASLPDDDYRYLEQQKKVAQVFLFCGNEERAKLLAKNFPKIKGFGLKCPQVIQVLQKFELEDRLDIPPCSLLTMLQEDRKTLNKYRLNYFCITGKHPRIKSKQNFVELAKTLCPQQNQKIVKFESEYNLTLKDQQQYQQVLSWAMDDNFFFKLIQTIPKTTTDPKKLAYLRLPFTDLRQAIFSKHKQIQKVPEALYLVVQLSPQEIQKLSEGESLNNFIIFTSFMKGFTKKADAIKQFKQIERAFLFQVNFTKRPKQKDLDFGFYISEDKSLRKNVIFNIYNFFQLEALQLQNRSATLVYGPLSEAFYNRADKNTNKRLTEQETVLLRNFDYLQDIIQKDDSQAVILQMSGYFKQSLQVYQRKVQYLRKIGADPHYLNKYILLRGDAYRINQDYEQAQKQYRSITDQTDRLVGLVHLMQLYLRKGDDRRAQDVQQELQSSSNMRKLKEKYPEESFRADNYIALSWMKQGKYKEALKKYKNLKTDTSMHYNYKFQGIPLVHDIFRNMATCEAKLNNHKEALNLLTSTKDWQLVCEGESAGLALTQTMIHTVHEQMGNKESARQTADNLHHLKQSIGLGEQKFLNQSMVTISMGLNPPKNVNQSGVNINLNPINVNQSAVNVNLNPQVNVNQSSVNVNLNPNINQSVVNVNMNPNINQSKVEVNMNEPIKQSSIQIDLNQPKKGPININNSTVDVKL